MNLKRLEYFMTVAQTGNLRKASEMLNISAPALSKAMKLLEDELETPLWMKDGRGIMLTDSGKLLLKRAPVLVDEFKQLKSSLHIDYTGPRPIKIGTFEVFSTYFLSFMDKLQWNNHSLELHELLPGEVEKYVAQGDLDIGITYMPVPDPQLDFLKITSIEMGVFVRTGAFKGVVQPELPFVVPVMPMTGTPTRMRGLDGWPEDAFERKVLHKVTLMESALELVRQGRVAGFFPLFVVNEHNCRVSDNYKLERRKGLAGCKVRHADVYIAKRKSFEESDVIKQLSKALRQVCG
jgi:DNA-binding transcriptional LysR family regulator